MKATWAYRILLGSDWTASARLKRQGPRKAADTSMDLNTRANDFLPITFAPFSTSAVCRDARL
jgi:hypothetical protein